MIYSVSAVGNFFVVAEPAVTALAAGLTGAARREAQVGIVGREAAPASLASTTTGVAMRSLGPMLPTVVEALLEMLERLAAMLKVRAVIAEPPADGAAPATTLVVTLRGSRARRTAR